MTAYSVNVKTNIKLHEWMKWRWVDTKWRWDETAMQGQYQRYPSERSPGDYRLWWKEKRKRWDFKCEKIGGHPFRKTWNCTCQMSNIMNIRSRIGNLAVALSDFIIPLNVNDIRTYVLQWRWHGKDLKNYIVIWSSSWLNYFQGDTTKYLAYSRKR